MTKPKTSLKDDLARVATKDLGRHNDQKHKEALRHIRTLEAQAEAARRLNKVESILKIVPRAPTGKSEATAVSMLSDVHIGETVRKDQVSGLNEYSVAICRRRCAQFFERIVRLTNKERQDVKIDELVLFLGGDIIDGALHLDTIMHNEVSEPMLQAEIAQEIIEGGLRYLVKHGKFKRITVVCKDGNHGRVTHKMHHSSRRGNALEWLIYRQLQERLPKLNWVIEDGIHTYLDLYGFVIRFHHGDSITGGSGVGGHYPSAMRRRHQWNAAKHADMDMFGHVHSHLFTRWVVSNGSVVGYNPYAMMNGFAFEKPMQAYFLVDKKRGPTISAPILLD